MAMTVEERKKKAIRMARTPVKRVPYERMQQAVEVATEAEPGADKYVPGFSFGEVYVEVWRKGSAKILFVDGI